MISESHAPQTLKRHTGSKTYIKKSTAAKISRFHLFLLLFSLIHLAPICSPHPDILHKTRAIPEPPRDKINSSWPKALKKQQWFSSISPNLRPTCWSSRLIAEGLLVVGRGNQQRTRGFHWHSLENISSTSMESTWIYTFRCQMCGSVCGWKGMGKPWLQGWCRVHDGELVGSGDDPSEHAAYCCIIQPIKSKTLPAIYISSVEII